jgi:TolA-binding protein
MKTVLLAAIVAACTGVPAFAQAQAEDHSAHHESTAPAAQQGASQPNCPMGMAMGGGNESGMQHMAQMQQMMQMMQQMQGQMQTMQGQMTQMQSQMARGPAQARRTHR